MPSPWCSSCVQIDDAFVHLVFVATIAAQQVVAQGQAVFHDLVADALDQSARRNSVEATAERAANWRRTVKIFITNSTIMIARIAPNLR